MLKKTYASYNVRSPEMGFVVFKNKVSYHMISKEYPPLFSNGGKRAEKAFKILSSEIGYTEEDGAKIVQLGPFVVFPAMVFLAVSAAVEPTTELWYMLMTRTPKSAVDLLFEVADAERLKTGGPLIPPRTMMRVARILAEILRVNGLL